MRLSVLPRHVRRVSLRHPAWYPANIPPCLPSKRPSMPCHSIPFLANSTMQSKAKQNHCSSSSRSRRVLQCTLREILLIPISSLPFEVTALWRGMESGWLMNECMNVYQSVWSQSAMSALGTVRHVASFVLAHSEKRSVNLQASSYKKFF